GAGIHQHPHCKWALAFGIAHEQAVTASIQFPVDPARLVAGLVVPVLRELQPGTALTAAMQAETTPAGGTARTDPEPAQLAAHLRRDRIPGHRRRPRLSRPRCPAATPRAAALQPRRRRAR